MDEHDELLAALADTYGATPEAIADDATAFLAQLAESGLVIRGE